MSEETDAIDELIGEDILGDSIAGDCSEDIKTLKGEIKELRVKLDSDNKEEEEPEKEEDKLHGTEPEEEKDVKPEDETSEEEKTDEDKDEEAEEKKDEDDAETDKMLPWSKFGAELVISKEGISVRKGGKETPYPLEPQKKESEYPAPDAEGDSVEVMGGRKLFYDSFKIDSESAVLEDGLLTVDAVIAKEIVQDYEEGGKKITIYKPADELEKSADTLSKFPRPVTNEHPDTKVVTSMDEIKGITSNVKFVDKGIPCKLNISDKTTVDDVQKGIKLDVSIGFYSDLEFAPGTVSLDGKEFKYDAIQRNILIDHVAITKEGRCNTAMGCGIKLDSKAVPKRLKEQIDTLIEEKRILSESLDSIESSETSRLKGELLSLTDHYAESRVDAMDLKILKDRVEFVKSLVSDKKMGLKDSKKIDYEEELNEVLK